MAYKTEIQIGVKGTAALDKLRKNIGDLNEKVNLIDKGFRTGIQSVAKYERALSKAADTLRKARANTDDERDAVQNYVKALGAANAAKERQNRLINEEIARRSKATAELKKYNAAAVAPRPAGGSMNQRYIRPGSPVARTQYDQPIGPQPDVAADFMRRTNAAAQAARRLTAEFLAQQRQARNLANVQREINSANFLARTDEAARKASRLTAEYAKQLRIQKEAANLAASRQITPGTQYAKPIGPQAKDARTGTAGFLEQAGAFGLGTGFPLLFGGGAGQVIGGGIGTALAKAFGLAGEAAMGLQIALSAIVGKVEELVRRFGEVGNAIRSLNMDALADTFITVNENARTLVRQLTEAGKAQAAVSVAANETLRQTGVMPEAVTDITNTVNLLSNTWDEVVASVSGLVSIIATPLLAALTVILQGIAKAVQGLNLIASNLGLILKRATELVFLIPGLEPILRGIQAATKGIVEEEEKGLAKLVETGEALEREYRQNEKLFEIEKGRTAGRTTAEKLVNAEIEKRLALQELEDAKDAQILAKRREFANVTGRSAQIELEYQEMIIGKNFEIEKSRINQTYELERQKIELEQHRDLMKEKTEDIRHQSQLLASQAESLNYQGQIIANNAALVNAQRQTQSDLLGLQISRLERQRDEARHFLDQIKLNNIIIDKKKEQAKLEYEGQLTSIKLGVAKAEQERNQVRLKTQQINLQLELVRIEAEGIENDAKREAALRRIGAQEKATLQVVEDMNRAAQHSLETTQKIAAFQQKSAKYAYQGKIEALETSREQGRMASFLNSQQKSMGHLVQQSGQYASNMARAANSAKTTVSDYDKGTLGATKQFQASTSIPIDDDVKQKVQSRGNFKSPEAMVSALEEAQKAKNRSQQISATRARQSMQKPRYDVYAAGGYATQPHLGMVGEAGPEYIVPERKAAAFATNYLMGARGASAIPRYADGGYVGPVNIQTGPVMQQGGTNYVTMDQFEKGLMDLATAVSASNRSYGARQYMGVQR